MKIKSGFLLIAVGALSPPAPRSRLPYEETRGYIVKALDAKKRYAAM